VRQTSAKSGCAANVVRLAHIVLNWRFPASEVRGQRMNKIGSVMTADVRLASPDQTIRDAATIMQQSDVGSLPVGDADRLIGMITDRDITLRAVAVGKDAIRWRAT
jgi:predicted transcriptional regulator